MPSKAIQKAASPPLDRQAVPTSTDVLSPEEWADKMRERWLPHLDSLMTAQLNIALNDDKGKPGIDARKAIFDRLIGPVREKVSEPPRQPIVIQFNRVEGGNVEIQRLEASLSGEPIEGVWQELADLPGDDQVPPAPPPELDLQLSLAAPQEPPPDPPLPSPGAPETPPEPPPETPKAGGVGPGGKYQRKPGNGFQDWKAKRAKDKPSAPGVKNPG